MASVIEIACPNCDKPLKVPDTVFGKKIKCKYCEQAFVVRDPDADERPRGKPAVKPSKPGGAGVRAKKPPADPQKAEVKKEEPKKEEPKPASTYKFEDDDDDGAKPTPLQVIDEGVDIPRCPHCAKELDPPDARVCIHCGFNTLTRVKAETKKVWEPDANDWINHLGPGILALVISIAILVLNVVVYVNMRDWMTGTFLMKDDKGPDGETAFFVKPGAFITFVYAADIMPFLACTRFAIKRLCIEYQPTEKIKL
jgi:hypothetical protein